jgi:hypothetical protein
LIDELLMQERLFSSQFIIFLAQVPDCLLVAEEPKKKHKRHPIHKALGGRSMAGFSSTSQPPVPQVSTSVAGSGCLSRIPDPDFYPSRIPDSKTAAKERGEKKICCHTFSVATNFT